MLLFMLILLTAVALVSDLVCYRRLVRRRAPLRRMFLLVALTTDVLPAAVALSGGLLRDNSTEWLYASMWLFWVWIVAVLPRLAFYLFALLRLRKLGVVVAAVLVATFIWGATAGRTRLHVNRIEIGSPRIPAGFDGFRIVQISDIHLGSLVRPEQELKRLTDSVNALHPDLIVFSGDLVNIRCSELDERAMRLLSGFDAPVVSVTGNHDVGAYIKDTVALPRETSLACVIARQRSLGWQVLEDTTVYLGRRGDTISLSGIAFDPELRQRQHDPVLPASNLTVTYRDVPDSLYNITVAHLPQLWEQITAAGYGDLTLSGHVHSMQMKLRFGGCTWSPARWIYTRWSGRYDVPGHTLYINDGTGYVAYPMRLGAWPEITLFTLKHTEVRPNTSAPCE